MKAFFVLACGLAGSWYFIDLSSASKLSSVLAPVMFIVFLISFVLWLIVKFHLNHKGDQSIGHGSGGYDISGGDGGGGGDGGC